MILLDIRVKKFFPSPPKGSKSVIIMTIYGFFAYTIPASCNALYLPDIYPDLCAEAIPPRPDGIKYVYDVLTIASVKIAAELFCEEKS